MWKVDPGDRVKDSGIYLKISQFVGYDAHRVRSENGEQRKHSVNDGCFFDADTQRFHVDRHVRQQNSNTFRYKIE